MIRTSIGTMQAGSPWLARQWINSIPGIQVTPGISQNNLTIRAGNKRPSYSSGQSAQSKSGSTGSGSSGGGKSGSGGGLGGSWGWDFSGVGGSGGSSGGDGGGDFTYT